MATPGANWSAGAAGWRGRRVAAVQDVPSVEVERTRSLAPQALSNRQSAHTTVTLPAASTSTVGLLRARTPDGTVSCHAMVSISACGPHVTPASLDTNERSWEEFRPFVRSVATRTSFPPGSTTGTTLKPTAPTSTGADHVAPPSEERTTASASPLSICE